MNKQRTKKGFTVTELIIVIVVIAVLAAVLIPTFVSLINKANTSADIQTVRNMNVIVAGEAASSNGELSAHEAIVAVTENGYGLKHITPTADGRTIAWDGANYCFVLLDDEYEVIYPEDMPETPHANLFIVTDALFVEGDEYYGFAAYLTEEYAGGAEISTAYGIDVGYHEISQITYTGSEEVAVRGWDYTTIVVTSGIVHHYDVAWTAFENGGEYVEHGTLNSEVKAGAPVETGFAGGSGTEDDPYLVASEEQLLKLEEFSGKPTHFTLIDDITFTTNEDEDGPYGYIYTYFQGVLDGNGHSIINTNSDTTAPCLFYGTYYYDATIKNLNYVVAGDVVKPLFYTNYSGYYCDGTALTIENVTVTGAEDKFYTTCSYGSGPFIQTNAGAVYFKNCVNEVSYTIAGSGYAGIFIGNYGFAETFASFENCVNKGTVSGVYPGFFCGNETKAVELTNNNTSPVFSSSAQVFYVNNCSNDGVMLGSNAVGAFGCNWPDKETTHDICDSALTEAQFHRGTKIVNSIDIGLIFDDTTVKIEGSDDANIKTYSISFETYLQIGDNGGSKFSYTETLTNADVANGKTVADVAAFITKAEYVENGGTYDKTKEQVSGLHRFIVVNNDDGTRTVVIDIEMDLNDDDVVDTVVIGDVEYAVSAYNANGQKIGYKEYR